MSGHSHYLGIPREKIPWYPQINPDLCTNCGACLEFCPNEVFAPGESSPVVVNPLNCVVGCSACARECPSEAISFMSQKELVALLQKLRQEIASGQKE
jgi:NAD-dependent dihydropyrimidine dehydrogenase PreA subunit